MCVWVVRVLYYLTLLTKTPETLAYQKLLMIWVFWFTVHTGVLPPPLTTSAVIDSNTVTGVRTRKSSTGSLDTLTSIAITAAVTTTSSGKYVHKVTVYVFHSFNCRSHLSNRHQCRVPMSIIMKTVLSQ